MLDWMPVSKDDTAYMYVRPSWYYYNTSYTTYCGGYSSATTVEEVWHNTIYTDYKPVEKKRRKVATLK